MIDMLGLEQFGMNITVGWVDTSQPEGELLKETFDIPIKHIPCVRLVKDGRFFN